jgi:hypothetical protein
MVAAHVPAFGVIGCSGPAYGTFRDTKPDKLDADWLMRPARRSCRHALAVLAVATLNVAPAAAQERQPHAEPCVQKGWGYLVFSGNRFGTVNTCAMSVINWFKMRDGDTIRHVVPPGEVFDTGLELIDRDWIFATCPEGYVPNPPFSENNWKVIEDSQYDCIKLESRGPAAPGHSASG